MAVNTFCVILLTHEAQIVMTMPGHTCVTSVRGADRGDNVPSGLVNTKYFYYILFTNIFFLLNILFHTNCRDNNSILSVHYKYIITECDAGDHEPDRSKLPRIWDLIQF